MKLIFLYIVTIATCYSVFAENLREEILKNINRQPTPVQAKFCRNTLLCAHSSELNDKQKKNGILGYNLRGFDTEAACRAQCAKTINQRCGEGKHSVITTPGSESDSQKPKYFQRCIAGTLFKGKVNNKTGDTKNGAVAKAICNQVGVCHSGSNKKTIAGIQSSSYQKLGYNSLKACANDCEKQYKKHCSDITVSRRKGTNLKPVINCLQKNMNGGNTRLMEISDEYDDVPAPANITDPTTNSTDPETIIL